MYPAAPSSRANDVLSAVHHGLTEPGGQSAAYPDVVNRLPMVQIRTAPFAPALLVRRGGIEQRGDQQPESGADVSGVGARDRMKAKHVKRHSVADDKPV